MAVAATGEAALHRDAEQLLNCNVLLHDRELKRCSPRRVTSGRLTTLQGFFLCRRIALEFKLACVVHRTT